MGRRQQIARQRTSKFKNPYIHTKGTNNANIQRFEDTWIRDRHTQARVILLSPRRTDAESSQVNLGVQTLPEEMPNAF
eukprot:3515020-Amphidinium_carterae.1